MLYPLSYEGLLRPPAYWFGRFPHWAVRVMSSDDSSMTRRLPVAVVAIGAARLGAGVALGGRPAPFLRWEKNVPPDSSMTLLMRTVGIRDLALGFGTASALRSGSRSELQRWIRAGLVSDVLDVAAGLASARTTGVRGLLSSLVASPAVALDLLALAALREAP
jgi:hypothetical protein